jgi:hypothetical protein
VGTGHRLLRSDLLFWRDGGGTEGVGAANEAGNSELALPYNEKPIALTASMLRTLQNMS